MELSVGWMIFWLNVEILQLFGGSYRKSKTTPETSNIGRINHQKLHSRSKPPAKRAKSGHLITDADSHGMPWAHQSLIWAGIDAGCWGCQNHCSEFIVFVVNEYSEGW